MSLHPAASFSLQDIINQVVPKELSVAEDFRCKVKLFPPNILVVRCHYNWVESIGRFYVDEKGELTPIAMYRNPTEKERKQIKSLYEQGVPKSDIQEIFGASMHQITRAIGR